MRHDEGMRIALALVGLALLGGCGSEDEEPAATTEATPGQVVLDIRFDDGEGGVRRASLRCARGEPEATGYLDEADPAGLCRSALALGSLFTEQSPERVCTQIFGGPRTARVTGTLEGAEVNRSFSRQNGCRIAEWDRLQAAGLLPAP